MATVGSLVVVVSANTAKFASDLGEAERKLGGLGRSANTAAGGLGALGKTAIVAGLAALAKVAWSEFRRLSEEIDATAKAAQRLGTSYAGLSKLQFAGEKAGTSGEAVTAAIERMQKNIGQGLMGKGEASDAFTALKLNLKDLAALAPDEAFLQIADALGQVESPAMKTALAMEIFGKSAGQLMPLLQSGREGIEAETRAFAAGEAIIEEHAGDVEWLNDRLSDLGKELKQDAQIAVGWIASLFRGSAASQEAAAAAEQHKRATMAQTEALLAEREAAKKAAEEHKRLAEERQKAADAARTDVMNAFAAMSKLIAEYKGKKADPIQEILRRGLERAASSLPVADYERYAKGLTGLAQAAREARAEQERMSKAAKDAAGAEANLNQLRTETLRVHNEQLARAQSLIESVRTPVESLAAELADIKRLYQVGAIDWETGNRAIAAAKNRFGQSAGAGAVRDPTFAASAAMGSAAAYEAIQRARQTGNETREERTAKYVELQYQTALKMVQLLETKGIKLAGVGQTAAPK